MKTKTLLVLLCCSLIIALCPVASANQETYYSTGDLLTDEDYLYIEEYSAENAISPLATYTPPMRYDLSESIYFPPIQNQGAIGSCGAFAMGYYQFTYEKNKLNAVSSTSADTWASPMWIYNTLNKDPIANHHGGGGLDYIDTDWLLRNQGAVSWSEMPYVSSNYDRVFTWEDDNAANILRNALKTRLSGRTHKSINGFVTGNYNTPSITSATDEDLNEIKELLANQKKF